MINRHPIMFLAFALVLGHIFTLTSAQCDQRKNGGPMLCCKGTNNSCWVRVAQNQVCYCDEYCHSTGDCCPDLKDIEAVCRGAQDCVISLWASWSNCNAQCGFGTMKRRRVVLQVARNGGKPCPYKREKKGCFQQKCKGDMVLAQILPAEFRRQPFGSYKYEKILPENKVLTEIQQTRKRFRSHCVNFKLSSKHPHCQGTWADKLEKNKLMCVECQPAIMDDQGYCKGEGIVGNYTSWVATDAKTCSGLWMRVGPKIPNCKCVDQEFQNFIFV